MNETSCETPGSGNSPPLGAKYRSGEAVGVGGIRKHSQLQGIAGERNDLWVVRNGRSEPPTPGASFLGTGGTFPLSGGLFAVPDTKGAE